MNFIERLFRVSFAIVSAMVMAMITFGDDPWVSSTFSGRPTLTFAVVASMLVIEFAVIWPVLRE